MLRRPQLTDRMTEFERACHAAGIKLTHQRMEVLREVARSNDHPTAEAIFLGVKKRLPSVSVDTVYRTLWLLTDLRLIATLGPRRDAVRFDANLTPHHHYVCERCGKISDVEIADLENTKTNETFHQYGTVNSWHLEARGVCRSCSNGGRSVSATK